MAPVNSNILSKKRTEVTRFIYYPLLKTKELILSLLCFSVLCYVEYSKGWHYLEKKRKIKKNYFLRFVLKIKKYKFQVEKKRNF